MNEKVFIAGSRRLSKLSKEVKQRIERIMARQLTVIVGDANGMDKSVQCYLSQKAYPNVIVFCMKGACRNNVGRWEVQSVQAAYPTRRDFAFYAAKDKAMVAEADYGLMLWDGKSRGTLTSILALVRRGKPAVVYLAPKKVFHTIRCPKNLIELLNIVGPDVLDTIGPELKMWATDQKLVESDLRVLF